MPNESSSRWRTRTYLSSCSFFFCGERAAGMAVPQKLLHSMLEALLDDLGYRGPKKSAEEILPQLHQQSGRRLESTEAKLARLHSHMEDLGAQTTAVADEVTGVQEAVSAKFAEMHRLLDEKEAQFKHDVAALAAQVATAIAEQEDECRVRRWPSH